MTYKTMLLTTAAVLFASQAMAADLTNPFYVPNEGQLVSTTNAGYYRAKAKHDAGVLEGYYAAETLEYGLNNNFSINGTLANMFDTQGAYNNDHNFAYQLGAKYNTRNDNVLLQASVNYATLDPQSFVGRAASNKWYKRLDGEVKLGYDMGNGLTPYASYAFGSEIDTADRELTQSASVGVHKYAGKYALDLAVRYDFVTDGKNTNEWWADAAVDYYLKDNVALGVYGSYFLDGSYSKNVDYAYDAGLRLKVLF